MREAKAKMNLIQEQCVTGEILALTVMAAGSERVMEEQGLVLRERMKPLQTP